MSEERWWRVRIEMSAAIEPEVIADDERSAKDAAIEEAWSALQQQIWPGPGDVDAVTVVEIEAP